MAPNNQRDPCRQNTVLNGFTLVEMVIALSLFAIMAVSTYSVFRGGFTAYREIESTLGKNYELKMLERELTNEFRNAVYYAPVPFEGESDKLVFPTRLRRYKKNHSEEGIYKVTYECRSGKLNRKEKKLRKDFGDRSRPLKETLLKLNTCQFQFAYKQSDGIVWKNTWQKQPYLGLPRGIRLILKGKVSGGAEVHDDFFIPHGILGEVR